VPLSLYLDALLGGHASMVITRCKLSTLLQMSQRGVYAIACDISVYQSILVSAVSSDVSVHQFLQCPTIYQCISLYQFMQYPVIYPQAA